MIFLVGLRFLSRNALLQPRQRLLTKTRRIPKRIEFYSRLAAEFNIIRSGRKQQSRLIANQAQLIDRDGAFTLEESVKDSRDEVKSNENYYIYRHIHKRLDKFAKLAYQINNLAVKDDLEKLTQHLKQEVRDEEYIKGLLVKISRQVKTLNQQELAVVLTAIKDERHRAFDLIRRMVDIELRWLLKKHVKTRLMDLDLWFYIADLFYECAHKSVFVTVFVDYFARDNDVNLSNEQFLHLLFLVILQRNVKDVLFKYEAKVIKALRGAAFEDLAIVALAYFKTKTKIESSNILSQLIDKTCESLPEIDPKEPGFCSIIKSIRYSSLFDCKSNVEKLVSSLITEDEGKIVLSSAYNLVHTVKMMEAYRIYDETLLEHLAVTMFEPDNDFRIKDVQYALTSLSNFAYSDLKLNQTFRRNLDMLCAHILREIRKDSELQFFHILPLLRAFAIFGYYNKDFSYYVNSLFDNQVIFTSMSSVFEFDRSALLAYVASRLESEDCAIGNNIELFKDISYRILRKNTAKVVYTSRDNDGGQIKKASGSKYRLMQSIANKLAAHKNLQGYNFGFQYTMPHQNYLDLVITKGFRLPGNFCPTTLMPIPLQKNRKYCLVYLISDHDYIDGSRRLSGYKSLLIRLIKVIGYDVVCIDWSEDPDIEGIARQISRALA